MKLQQILYRLLKKSSVNFLTILALFITTFSFSQELNCNVIVDATQVQTQEKQIFKDLEAAIYDFMNSKAWTNHDYRTEEKISCNIIIQVTEISSPTGGIFKASAQIQSSRPVYNSDYETVTFNFADKNFNFDYMQSQDLFFNENSYTSNLTSLLAFYAYVIIGYDYDSFSKLGGTEYFNKAREIVNNAQQAPFEGWQAFQEINNRYWIIEDIMNVQFEPFRRSMYDYHRLILDTFTDPSKHQQHHEQLIQMLKEFKTIRNIKPTSITFNTFFNYKKSELATIFAGASPAIKTESYNVLIDLDPSNSDTYKKINP